MYDLELCTCLHIVCLHRLYTRKWIGDAAYIIYIRDVIGHLPYGVTACGKLVGDTNDKESVLL